MYERVGQTLFSRGLVNILIRKNLIQSSKYLNSWTKTKSVYATIESFFGLLKHSLQSG